MTDKKVSKKVTDKKIVNNEDTSAKDKELNELSDKVEKLASQIDELKNQRARALADYQNLEKRTLDNELKFREYANEDIINELLEVLDDLGSSVEHVNEDGIKNVYKKLTSILEKYGVEEINNKGKFNPDLHEAIENTEGEKDKIIKVYRKGYLYKGKLLRPSMVAVGSG